MKRILIIDDELAMPGSAAVFRSEYPVKGVSFHFCGSLEEAHDMEYWTSALVLLDIRFEGRGDEHGISILKKIRTNAPRLPVVMLSSRTSPDILIRCWDAGAQGYIVKWTANPDFHRDLEEKISRHSRYIPGETLVGGSASIRELRGQIETLADYDLSVLVTGETGTGKELVAQALHHQGKRAESPLIAVNCGAIPATLIESELFGYVKGAFTGATADRKGKIEAADQGTLFLDEIGDLPLAMQTQLLRFLDSGEFVRVGDTARRHADVRVVAATNRNLQDMAREKKFREDLLFRLNGFQIHVPPLRERRDDVPLLVEHFLELFKNGHPEKSSVSGFLPNTMEQLQAYHWPGNVRELKHVVERSIILTVDSQVGPQSLPPNISGASTPPPPNHIGDGMAALGCLPEIPADWSRQRLLAELRMAVQAKHHVQKYKGKHWKAEFMRLMYPECKAANAKGFSDLIRRLTKGPWGDPGLKDDIEARRLFEELKH